MKSLHKILTLSLALATSALTGCIASGDSADGSVDGSALRTQGSTANEPDSGKTKVTICHLPPGNPANVQVITVGAPAVQAHLDHGDSLGDCPEVVPPDTIVPPYDNDPEEPPAEVLN